MAHKQTTPFHSVRSSLAPELETLDPLVSKAGLPPTEGQFEAAEKLGIDIRGKNPGTASIAIGQARRELAQKLIEKHKYIPEMVCMLDGKKLVVIQKVNTAKGFFQESGAQVFVKTIEKPIRTHWVHPYRLSSKL